MILHLHIARNGLSLWGEAFGRTVSERELKASLGAFFGGWQEVVLSTRGALHMLQWVRHELPAHTLVYGDDLRKAAEALGHVLRIVAAGQVVPLLEQGEARWRATLIPEDFPEEDFQALTDAWMRTCSATMLSRAQAARGKFYTADDAWLAALRSPEATLGLPADGAFETQVQTWAEPLFEGGREELHFTPRADERGWWLDVEGLSDWQSGQAEAPMGTLRLLGQAIAVAPMLTLPQPWSAETFVKFLREAVPALRAAAFVIALPPALEAEVPQLHETAVALEGDEVQLRRTITFGGIELSIEEAQALVDAGEALAFVQGEWRYVDLVALRTLLESLGPARLSRQHALPLLLAGVIRVEPTAQEVQNFLREMTQPPEGALPLRGVLRPYQAQGVCWLMQAAAHGLGVCLADDMGLGKTLQSIAFLMSRPGPALIVAPLSVLPVWEREFARWAPQMRILRHDGALRLLNDAFRKQVEGYDVVLTAYGYLWRDYTSLRRIHWRTLVLDEAQLIKNPNTRQSQAARSLTADFRLALTGTPIENRLEDLWSILDFLNPNLFGARKDFAVRYANPERLRKAAGHFLLRRLKSDPAILAELPPKIEQIHYAPLSELQSAAYDMALADYARTTHPESAGERAGAVLTLLTRLKQICIGLLPEADIASTFPSAGKAQVLWPLLEEILAKGESALIFSQFTTVGAELQRELSERLGYAVPFLHGGLTSLQRRAQIAAFNDRPQPGVLILSLRTGAFGLTLTKANHVIHLDRWWNPAVEAQASDRVHRIGQQRTVVVHHLLCRGTLEDRIDRLLREKQSLAEQIIAPTPTSLLTRLPTDTLLSLLERNADPC